jgi:Protein of unknown function, DUF547
MTRILSILSVLLISFPLQALAFDHSYTLWNKDLAQFNDGGYVHYGKWQRNPARLDRFLSELQAVSVQEMGQWSGAQREAFWINAHNALVVSNILRVYPALNKLEDVPHKIVGQKLTAANIRDRILRGSETRVPMVSDILMVDTTIAKGHDRRILFAMCDGTRASPLLAATAYTAGHLSAQLDEQVSRTVANPDFVRVDTRLKVFHVGDFFRTYQEDFKTYKDNAPLFEQADSSNRGLLRFIFPYLDKSVQDKVLAKQNTAWQVDYRMSSHDLNGGN